MCVCVFVCMCVCVCVYVCVCVCVCVWWEHLQWIFTQSGFAGSQYRSIFDFLRNCIVFHYNCINLESHQQCISIYVSPHPCQCLSFVFLIFSFQQMWSSISLWFWFAFPDNQWNWTFFQVNCSFVDVMSGWSI